MAIKQYEIIKAQDIQAAGINVTSGNYIKATDISSLYSGTDTIAPGVLIKAEHFISIGIPGTNGLNGIYGGKTFTEAIKSGWIEYDSEYQILKILTSSADSGSTLKFTNFGKFSSTTSIFMIGGGGAGNNKGYDGNGGNYITDKTKNLELNKTYTLKIGKGGASNGAKGTNTEGFDEIATGGVGGLEIIENIQYRIRETTDGNWQIAKAESETRTDENGNKYYQIIGRAEDVEERSKVHTRYIFNEKNEIVDETRPVSYGNNSEIRNCIRAMESDHYYWSAGGSYPQPGILVSRNEPERQTEGADSTIFSGTTYGGSGGTSSNTKIAKGQGGFSTFTNPNEANAANSGGDGIILIKFTNK